MGSKANPSPEMPWALPCHVGVGAVARESRPPVEKKRRRVIIDEDEEEVDKFVNELAAEMQGDDAQACLASQAAAHEVHRAKEHTEAVLLLSRATLRVAELTQQLDDAHQLIGEAGIEDEVSDRTHAAVQRALDEQAQKHETQSNALEAVLNASLAMERKRALDANLKLARTKVELEKKDMELETAKAAARLSERKAEAAAQESTCSVCLSSKKNTVFLPCFHLATCSDCASRCRDRCPICRAERTGSMRVYIA